MRDSTKECEFKGLVSYLDNSEQRRITRANDDIFSENLELKIYIVIVQSIICVLGSSAHLISAVWNSCKGKMCSISSLKV